MPGAGATPCCAWRSLLCVGCGRPSTHSRLRTGPLAAKRPAAKRPPMPQPNPLARAHLAGSAGHWPPTHQVPVRNSFFRGSSTTSSALSWGERSKPLPGVSQRLACGVCECAGRRRMILSKTLTCDTRIPCPHLRGRWFCPIESQQMQTLERARLHLERRVPLGARVKLVRAPAGRGAVLEVGIQVACKHGGPSAMSNVYLCLCMLPTEA